MQRMVIRFVFTKFSDKFRTVVCFAVYTDAWSESESGEEADSNIYYII